MKVKKKWFAAIAALLVILFVLSSVVGFLIPTTTPPAWQGAIAPYQNISVESAYAFIKYSLNLTNMVVLDVRPIALYNVSHIKFGALEAVNIPVGSLLTNLTAYNNSTAGYCPLSGDQNDLIIVYCSIGQSSTTACGILVDNPYVNFTNVYNVIGGFTDYYLNTIGNPTANPLQFYWNFSDTVVVEAAPPTLPYTDIAVSDAYQMITNGSSTYGSCNMVVDVRTSPTSWVINSTTPPILNATFMPYSSDSQFGGLLPGPLTGYASLPIIVYCQNDACDLAAEACQYLGTHGYSKVYHMDGGFDGWTAAGYPVGPIITPPPVTTTFGYTTIGSQHGQWGSSTLDACKYTSPASITTISQISVYMAAYSGTVNAEACIYADNSGVPGALLATSTQVTGIGTTPSWVNFTLTLAASPSTVYWLGVEASNNYVVWFTSGSTKQLTCQYAMSYPTFPNPWTTESAYGNYMQSIYASYT